MQCQFATNSAVLQLNIKKLLSIAYFNLCENLVGAESSLNEAKSQFEKLQIDHGVAVCSLAKSHYLFSKIDFIKNEQFDRKEQLILLESYRECQTAHEHFAKISHSQGVKCCMKLQSSLIQRIQNKDMIRQLGAIKRSKIVNKWPSKRRSNAILSLLLEVSGKEAPRQLEVREHHTYPEEATDQKLKEAKQNPAS